MCLNTLRVNTVHYFTFGVQSSSCQSQLQIESTNKKTSFKLTKSRRLLHFAAIIFAACSKSNLAGAGRGRSIFIHYSNYRTGTPCSSACFEARCKFTLIPCSPGIPIGNITNQFLERELTKYRRHVRPLMFSQYLCLVIQKENGENWNIKLAGVRLNWNKKSITRRKKIVR